MPRYDQWRRLTGNSNRPDLLDLGKRLLGYLAEQRALSGVKSMVIQRQAPDGSIVRARFVEDLPEIHIQEAAPNNPQPPPEPLQGFIVRPSEIGGQYANTDKNHVVLSARGSKWRASFYDAASVPEDYALGKGYYGVSPPLPDLFPDGLMDYGNLDWRNGNETVMVTFHGPESRYFGEAGDYKAGVFYKAQLLLNLADVALVAYTGGAVRGACIRSVDDLGPCLFVLAQYPENSSTGFVRQECLYRFRVAPTQAAKSAAPGEDWPLLAALEVVAGSETLLAQWSLNFDIFGEHPWCFNQSGTEARCIRYYDNAELLVEAVVDVEAATYVEITSPLPTTEKRSTAAYTARRYPHAVTNEHGDGGVEYFAFDMPGTFGGVVVYGDVVLEYDGTDMWTPQQEWVRCAVDYRNDSPVYADSRVCGHAFKTWFTRTLVASTTYTSPFPNIREHITEHTISLRATDTWEGAGIRTDWCEYRAIAQSLTCLHDGTESNRVVLDRRLDDEIIVNEHHPDYTVDTVKVDNRLYVWYCDLRYRLLATLEKTVTQTRAMDMVVSNFDAEVAITTTATSRFVVNANGVVEERDSNVVELLQTEVAKLTAANNSGHVWFWSIYPTGVDPLLSVPFAVSPGPSADNGEYSATVDVTENLGGFFNGTIPSGINTAFDLVWITPGNTQDYRLANNLRRSAGFQAYKGKFCFSMALPHFGDAVFSHGVGTIETGNVSEQTITALTGATVSEVRFHPISVLTPTALPR